MKPYRITLRTAVGIILTLGVMGVACSAVWFTWPEFARLELNELGDFLGGLGGVLALLWLIIGYMQQGEELRLQRRELSLTRDTLVEQGNELERQANVLETQLANEQAQREPAPLLIRARSGTAGPDGKLKVIEVKNHGAPAAKVIIEPVSPEGIRTSLELRAEDGKKLIQSNAWEYGNHLIIRLFVSENFPDDAPLVFLLRMFNIYGEEIAVRYRLENDEGPLTVLKHGLRRE